MRSFLKIIFPIACFAFVISSCDPAKEFETEIKSIDSCISVLDKIDSLFKGIEFDSLNVMVDHVNNNEELMREYYTSDTIDQLLGSYMNSCKGIRKSLNNLETTKTDFADEIAAIYSQLNNLKTDVSNGVFEKKEIDKYLATEKEALNKLNLSFTEFYTIQRDQKGVYYLCVPFVDGYVNALNVPGEDTLQ